MWYCTGQQIDEWKTSESRNKFWLLQSNYFWQGYQDNSRKNIFSTNGAGTTDIHMKKKEASLIPYTKINSKWIEDLNVSPKTKKILKENTGISLWSLIWHGFLSSDPKNMNKIKK